MTTDITELLQKRNAAISRLSRAFEPGHSSQTELDALSFAVDVMNELAEALEKAQAKNALVAGGIEAAAKLHERIAELESEVEKWKQESEQWEQVAEKQLAAAIALESRTVKLPESFKLAKSSSGLTYYYADEVDAALTSQGIKLEEE